MNANTMKLKAFGLFFLGAILSLNIGAQVVTDSTSADFGAGSTGLNTFVSLTDDGEVILFPLIAEEFEGGPALPDGWTSHTWETGGTATVALGALTVNGAFATLDLPAFDAGHSMSFVATFTAENFQHVGFGVDLDASENWAMFSVNGSGNLSARSNNAGTVIDTVLDQTLIGSPHLYTVDWQATQVVYSVDGTVVATHATAIATPMLPVVSDFSALGVGVTVNWIHVTPYALSGTFESRVLDGGKVVNWGPLNYDVTLPGDVNTTAVVMSVRTGNTPTPDESWSAYAAVDPSGTSVNAIARYLQYRAELLTTDDSLTPVLSSVTATVVPSILTVSAPNTTIAYGDTVPTVFTPTYSGFLNGDTEANFTAPVTCTSTVTATSGAGTYPVTCTGGASPDYTFNYVDGSVVITPTPLSVTASDATVVYGSDVPAITPTYIGFVNGETEASLTTPSTCSTTATSTSPVGTYAATCTGATSPNYTITPVDGTVTVTAATLTISASSATMTAGDTPPEITPSYSGFVNGETEAVVTTPPTCSTTATATSDAGFFPSTCTGAVAPNYDINYVNGVVTVIPALTAPVFTSAASATFVQGFYSEITVAASGSPAPTFAVTDGTLPDGVTLDATTGLLSGTATTAGTFTVTITASNGIAPDATQEFTLTVGAQTAPAFTSPNNATFTEGEAKTIVLTATGAPAPTFSLVSGTLPAGLVVGPTGIITGRPGPNTAGTYNVVIGASNGVTPDATQNFTVKVLAASTGGSKSGCNGTGEGGTPELSMLLLVVSAGLFMRIRRSRQRVTVR